MTAKRTQSNSRVQVPIRLPKTLRDQLRRKANRDGRSMNRQMEKLVRDYVESK